MDLMSGKSVESSNQYPSAHGFSVEWSADSLNVKDSVNFTGESNVPSVIIFQRESRDDFMNHILLVE
jgi:hypothetical protein